MPRTDLQIRPATHRHDSTCALDDSAGVGRRSFLRGAIGLGVALTGSVGSLVGFSPTASAKAAAVRCDARPPQQLFSCGPSYHPCFGPCSDTQSCCYFGPSGSNFYACCRCGGPFGCGRARVVVYASGKACYFCCQRC